MDTDSRLQSNIVKTYIFTFHTHFEAVSAFKSIKACPNIIELKMIAVPRKLSSSCGTALRVKSSQLDILPDFVYDTRYECVSDDVFIAI